MLMALFFGLANANRQYT